MHASIASPAPPRPPEVPARTTAGLGSAEYHVLLVLSEGDRHGYGIMREVEGDSEGRVRLGSGTLYGAIRSLLDAGFIQRSTGGPVPSGDESRRNYYRLTHSGRDALLLEAERLEAFLRLARARRVIGDSTP